MYFQSMRLDIYTYNKDLYTYIYTYVAYVYKDLYILIVLYLYTFPNQKEPGHKLLAAMIRGWRTTSKALASDPSKSESCVS